MYSPLWKITHQNPSVLCTPPFEKSPITVHRFCVLPPLKNHPSKPIGFVYSPLWKITHHSPSVLCTPPLWKITHQKPSVLCIPPFEKSLFLVGIYFGVGVYLANTVFEIKNWRNQNHYDKRSSFWNHKNRIISKFGVKTTQMIHLTYSYSVATQFQEL